MLSDAPFAMFVFLFFLHAFHRSHISSPRRAHTHTRTPRAGFSKDRANWFHFLKCSKSFSLRLIRMELIFRFNFFSWVIEFPSFSGEANSSTQRMQSFESFALIWPVYKLRSCAQSHGAHKHTRHTGQKCGNGAIGPTELSNTF